MIAAIYSRKSKYTGKGESVENQISFCKEYGLNNLSVNRFLIYEDEGYSGGNIRRPEFLKMMSDASNKRFDVLICYRLDRISRNISDFTHLINELDKYEIHFISVREQFDTTRPIGRAMMYIASVFSQLERETIAERIKDNMLELSKSGRWLGGVTPTGYVSKQCSMVNDNNKEVNYHILTPVNDEILIVKQIYNLFIENASVGKVEAYLAQKGIMTKNGLFYRAYTIKYILTNPVYAIADGRLYEYLKEKGYIIYSDKSEFNGLNGLMAYNKSLQKNKKIVIKDISEWIIAVGNHNGIIPSDIWIRVQDILCRNKDLAVRKVKSSNSLLSGHLFCSCGSYMRPKSMRRTNKNGETSFYYICESKEKSKGKLCSNGNINGNLLDKKIMNEIYGFIIKHPPIGLPQNFPSYEEMLELMDVKTKRKLIGCIIERLVWDGESIDAGYVSLKNL